MSKVKLPIVIPRPVFLITDALFAVIGVLVVLVGTPALSVGVWETGYGAGVAVTAVVAFIGCLLQKDVVEMVGALLLFCLLSIFVVAGIGLTALSLLHAVFALIIIEAALMKGARGFSLLFAQIRRWVTDV